MLRRLGLVALVLFVVLPGLWLGIEHLRGRSQLTEVLAELRAGGATLDIDRIKAPNPMPSSNGMTSLLSAVSALNRAGNLLPPAVTCVAPGRAIAPNQLEHWPEPENSNSWATLDAWVAAHAGNYDALHQALEFPVRRQVLDYGAGFSRLLVPHLAPIKSGASALSLSAAVAAQHGEFDTAVADLEGLQILQTDLAGEPLLISQLVRVAVASIASARVWSVSHAQAWNDSQLARLQAALPVSNFAADMNRSLEGERALCYAELTRHSTEVLADLWFGNGFGAGNGGNAGELALPTNFEEATNLAGTLVRNLGEGLRRRVLFPLWRFGWGDQALAFYLRCGDRMIEANRAAAAATSLAKLREFNLAALLESNSIYAGLHTVVARLALPALDRALLKALRAHTEVQLQATDLAIRRYRLRHDRLPERLADLVPDFLPVVPLDGMDGQPLRYRRDEADTYVLWSVGEDLTDNDGDASWPKDKAKGPNKHWWNARDAVLPQPATPEQIVEWRKSLESTKTGATPRTFQLSPELMKRYGLLPKSPSTNAPAVKGREEP